MEVESIVTAVDAQYFEDMEGDYIGFFKKHKKYGHTDSYVMCHYHQEKYGRQGPLPRAVELHS